MKCDLVKCDLVSNVRLFSHFRSLLPNRSNLHCFSESISFISKPGIVSWRKRSLRIKSNWWQCRRKCSLSSVPLPHIQVGLLRPKLCHPQLSQIFDTFYVNGIINRVLGCFTVASSFLLNSDMDCEFFMSCSGRFHS